MAGKRSIGSLLVQVGADTRQLNSAMGEAETKVRQFGSSVKRQATGARAQFAGMGNSASAALSRMGALGRVPALLSGGTAAAAGAAAFAGFRAVQKSAMDAHQFSPASVKLEAFLEAEKVRLDSEFGKRFPLATAVLNNMGAAFENQTKKAVLGVAENDTQLAAIGKIAVGTLTQSMMGPIAGIQQLIGLVQYIRDRFADESPQAGGYPANVAAPETAKPMGPPLESGSAMPREGF